jgi:hypothetical protein
MGWGLAEDVRKAYAGRRLMSHGTATGVRLSLEEGIPVFIVPHGVSGRELPEDKRLRWPKPRTGWKYF